MSPIAAVAVVASIYASMILHTGRRVVRAAAVILNRAPEKAPPREAASGERPMEY